MKCFHSVKKGSSVNNDRLSYKWQDRMGYLLALSAVLCPYILTHLSETYTIEASIWSLYIHSGTVGFILHSPTDWISPLLMLLITGPQLLTAYFMYRYYEGKTSLKRAYYVAFIMLSPMLIIDFINFLPLLTNPAWIYVAYFPFPVIVIIFALLTSVYPPRSRTPQWLQDDGEMTSGNESPISSP